MAKERLGGYLLFKLLLISAVVEPDTLDLLILLSWYTLLGSLRSLSSVAGSAAAHSAQSGRPPPPGVLRLLLAVLACDVAAAASCAALFRGAGWGMVLLLTCDCALLGGDALCHVARYTGAAMEERRARRAEEIETMQLGLHARRRAGAGVMATVGDGAEEAVYRDGEGEGNNDANNDPVAGDGSAGAAEAGMENGTEDPVEAEDSGIDAQAELEMDDIEEESHRLDQQLEASEAQHASRLSRLDDAAFVLELWSHVLTILHFLHIWSLHGFSFGLVDGVLGLHLHSAVTSAGRKIADRRGRRRLARDLDSHFQDATELELRKASAAGDVCCICLGTMSPVGAGAAGSIAVGASSGGSGASNSATVKKIGCGHLYHAGCLREVVERARSLEAARCPLCRAYVVDGRHDPPSSSSAAPAAQVPARGQGQGAVWVGNGGVAEGMTALALAQEPDAAIDNNLIRQQHQQRGDGTNNHGNNGNGNGGGENGRALFRFSTEGMFPAWVPLPAFSFEVVRRPAAPGGGAAGVDGGALRAGRIVAGDGGVDGADVVGGVQPDLPTARQQQQELAAPAQQPPAGEGNQTGGSGSAAGETPLWRRFLVLAGVLPMSPEEEAAALEQLTDMFPQYALSDLRSELRRLGSAEAVVEAVLTGVFVGIPHGGGGGGTGLIGEFGEVEQDETGLVLGDAAMEEETPDTPGPGEGDNGHVNDEDELGDHVETEDGNENIFNVDDENSILDHGSEVEPGLGKCYLPRYFSRQEANFVFLSVLIPCRFAFTLIFCLCI